MASVLPSALLEKMRPDAFNSPQYADYFKNLEQVLIQIQDQTGSTTGIASNIPDVVGVLSPLSAQALNAEEGDSFTNAEFIEVGADRTTQGNEIIDATANITVTLRGGPEDGEIVHINADNSRVVIDSPINIISITDQIGVSDSSACYRYHEKSNQWIQTSISKKQDKFVKQVYSASDFDNPARSDVAYVINGAIDLGSTQINYGSGGLTIKGSAFNTSFLVSNTDNYTMFNGTAGGNIDFKDVTFTTSGANSKVFGLADSAGNSALDLTRVNFVGCTSLGYIDAYRQLFVAVCALISCDDGLEFRGTWSGGARITDTIALFSGDNFKFFGAGSGLTFGSRFFTNANIQLPAAATSSVSDFSPSNFTQSNQFQMTGAQVTRGGVIDNDDPNYFPNISETDSECLWLGNTGINNTDIGGFWRVTTEIGTVIADTAVLYKLAGTTTYSNLDHFTQTTDNAFVFDSSIQTSVDLFASFELEGNNGDEIKVVVRVWDESAAAYVDFSEIIKPIVNYTDPSDRAIFTIVDRVKVSQNDRIELWVQNLTATNDVTLLNGAVCRIKE